MGERLFATAFPSLPHGTMTKFTSSMPARVGSEARVVRTSARRQSSAFRSVQPELRWRRLPGGMRPSCPFPKPDAEPSIEEVAAVQRPLL